MFRRPLNNPELGHYLEHHAFQGLRHLAVGEPHHPEALRNEMLVPFCIAPATFRSLMLRTIDLDHQSLREADEIDDELIDRRLPPEVEPLTAKFTQLGPEFLLVDGQ